MKQTEKKDRPGEGIGQTPANAQIRNVLYQKAAAAHIPLGGTFELTPCCNMNCRMCYVRLTKEEQERAGRLRTAKEWIELGRKCRDAGMLFLLLTGGEPFLRQDFREIYEGLYQMGLMISINTNGTMITEETVQWLKKMPPVKVNLTIYGTSPEAYEKLCGYRQGYDRAMNAVKMLQEAGIYVSANVSFTPDNIEEYEKFFTWIDQRDLPTRMTPYMFPPMRKRELDDTKEAYRTDPEEAGRMMFEIEKFKYRKGFWEERKEWILDNLPDTDRECPFDEKMRCMAGRSVFWVTWDYRLLGCGIMKIPMLRTSPESFPDDWKKLGVQMEKLLFPKECSVCKMRASCTVCGAVLQAEAEYLMTNKEEGEKEEFEKELAKEMRKKPIYLCSMVEAYLKLVRKEKEGDANQ